MGRRKNGTGGISLRKDGRWEGRIVIGYNERGFPITKNAFALTKTECADKLNALKNELQPTDVKISADMAFGEWMDFWYLTYSKPKLKRTTQSGYENAIYNHVIPELGKMKLKDITTEVMQKFYNRLKAEGRKIRTDIYGTGLSDRSVRACHAVCKSALDKAVTEKVLFRNPTDGCKLPPKKAHEMKILTPYEIRRLLLQAQEEGFFEMFLLDISTGMRRGELLALRWEDIDFITGELRICRQVHPTDGKLTISEPKTKHSCRTIILPQPTLSVLKKYKGSTASGWLFPSPLNPELPREPAACRKALSRILEHAGCKHVRFHDLRHTFATMALENGVDIKTLADLLGHNTAATTLNTYSHITDTMRRSAADSIDRKIAHVETLKSGRVYELKITETQTQPPFEPYRGRIRKCGTGCISRINDNLWEGRYSPRVNGKRISKNVYAHSEAECETKLAEVISRMKSGTES